MLILVIIFSQSTDAKDSFDWLSRQEPHSCPAIRSERTKSTTRYKLSRRDVNICDYLKPPTPFQCKLEEYPPFSVIAQYVPKTSMLFEWS